MKVFVTGGAGYIGAHVAYHLAAKSHVPIIIDDFRRSNRKRVGSLLFEGIALENTKSLLAAFEKHKPEAVVHLAGYISVAESVKKPQMYWENNLGAASNLLLAAAKYPIRKFIFSSTAATYGNVRQVPIPETSPTEPTCPYGESKLIFERLLYGAANALDFHATSLRYFNAAGACSEWGVGEDHDPEEHLIPRIIRALQKNEQVKVYGSDYPTSDGTCVRDYIHVLDLAEAHVLALEAQKTPNGESFNVGTGQGYSVLEVIQCVGKHLGIEPKIEMEPRRAGDPASLVADSKKLTNALGWKAEHSSLDKIVSSAIEWEKKRQCTAP